MFPPPPAGETQRLPNICYHAQRSHLSWCVKGITRLYYAKETPITKNINLVSIGNGVEVLPNGFVEGSQIKDVTIPGSVKTIGDNAFASCSKLSTVTNYALTPQSINESVFQNVDVSFCTLYVPAESNSLYASANVWKDFFIQNAGVEGVEVDKSTKEIEGYYNLHGIRIKEPIRGQVNIVRYSDGSAEKLVIK